MQRKALMISLAIHIAALVPFVIPPGAANSVPKKMRTYDATLLAPPAARKTLDSQIQSQAGRQHMAASPVELPSVPDSLVIEIDTAGFENIFAAADHWGAALRTGVPYSDPGTFQVFFCRPADYGVLDGRYRPGDTVWFAFPLVFRQRIFERLGMFVARQPQHERPASVIIGFTRGAPDYFEIRAVRPTDFRASVCS